MFMYISRVVGYFTNHRYVTERLKQTKEQNREMMIILEDESYHDEVSPIEPREKMFYSLFNMRRMCSVLDMFFLKFL